ncbi:unnamed protein product [Prorocentrum cordatum]|uniref:Phytanoyl-CoA dioxygenase family protein n=1 Tax=Prorocentrum cordatum TaxID=2364126 RepID=A0ABN9X0P9_9DINO|nr:unnamed protein product [Polarella glacialis]
MRRHCRAGVAAALTGCAFRRGASFAAGSPPRCVVDYFRQHGHVVTRGLLPEEEFGTAAREMWQLVPGGDGDGPLRPPQRRGQPVGGASRPFTKIANPHSRIRAALRLAFSPAMLGTAAALLGAASVRLHQDSLFLKRRGEPATAWHADLWTAPLATGRFVTAWLPLHRVEIDGAPLFFKAGSHLKPQVTIQCTPGPEADALLEPGAVGAHHAPLREGDVTWHHGWTIHGSPPLSGGARSRLAYTAAYYAEEAGFEAWLGKSHRLL